MTRRLLLLSNSRDPAGNYLVHPRRQIRAFLGARVETALYIPFASVTASFDESAALARAAFAEMGYALDSIHEAPDATAAVREAHAIVVSGGNTFQLLTRLYAAELLDVIRERVRAGVPYIGWSAGSVVACPTIKTTNDMPIVEPPSLAALGLVPFQINAHYTDFHPPGFRGETRAERIAEFLAVNPDVTVVGLPEGTMLQVENDRMALHGEAAARIFVHGRAPADHPPGQPLDDLLRRG